MDEIRETPHWTTAPWLSFDTETTGVNPSQDRIVSASTVLQLGGSVDLDPASTVNWLINPLVPIPASAAAVHGISTEYAREHGAPPAQALEEITEALSAHVRVGGALVVFNAGFDLPLLEHDSKRHQIPSLSARAGDFLVIDPLVLDRALVPRRRGKRTLGDLCTAYGVRIDGRQHSADVDAETTLRLAQAMVRKFPALGDMTNVELSKYQRQAHAAWATDFERWLRSRGKDTHIDPTWY